MHGFDTAGSMADILGGTAGNVDIPTDSMDWVNVFAKFGVDYDGTDATGFEFAETGGGGTDGVYSYNVGGATSGSTDFNHDEPSFF